MILKSIEDLNLCIEDGDRGKQYPTSDEFSSKGFCLFLNNKNIVSNRLCLDDAFYITEEKHKALKSGTLGINDIVLTTRGTLGNSLLVDDNFPLPARINSGMIIIHPSNKINQKFLFYLFQSRFFRDQLQSLQSGAAQPQLPIRDLKKIQIPCFSEKIQQHIVNIVRYGLCN